MAEAAVDCGVHNKNKFLHCRLCTPTGESLYIDDLHKDMTVRSPCKSMEKENIMAKEILVDDKKYAYYDNNGDITILEWREDLNGYTELARNDPLYAEIYRQAF